MDEIALAKLEMVCLCADVRGKYPAELSGGRERSEGIWIRADHPR